jgi:hypothetical protein
LVPIFDRFEGIERPALLGKYDLGGLGPNEGLGVGVVVVEVVVDYSNGGIDRWPLLAEAHI